MLHKVSDLPVEARGVVESLIGRPLAENETVSDARSAREAASRLEQYFAEIDAQHPPIAAGEAESAIDEAMRSVRPGYTPYR